MVERLSRLDASFLYLEEPGTPMHVGGVLILEAPPGGLEALAALVEARLSLVPRYRQRVAEVPGHLANPVWVDDPDFDLAYHLRRSGLPRPGTEAQLLDLVSRLTSRPLDRNRPLWEAYLVEGLSGRPRGRGDQDPPRAGRRAQRDRHRPGAARRRARTRRRRTRSSGPRSGRPTGAELVWEALDEYVRRPVVGVETVRGAVTDVRSTAARVSGHRRGAAPDRAQGGAPGAAQPAERARRAAAAGGRGAGRARRRQADPQGARWHGQRRPAQRADRCAAGVAALPRPAGGRRYVGAGARADLDAGRGRRPGNRVSSYLVDLPVGEPNPRVRLTRLSYAMRGTAEHGRSVGADSLIALTGFAPPTLHALGARAARGLSRRLFNLVVTNVPGPQVPLYAAGGQMLEVFPVVPLASGQGLSIGMTSYNGRVFFGLNADLDSVGDVDILADLIEQEVGELVETLD